MLHLQFAPLELCPPIRAHYLFLFADAPVFPRKVSFFPVLLCLFLRDTETKWQLQIDNRVWVQKKGCERMHREGFSFRNVFLVLSVHLRSFSLPHILFTVAPFHSVFPLLLNGALAEKRAKVNGGNAL